MTWAFKMQIMARKSAAGDFFKYHLKLMISRLFFGPKLQLPYEVLLTSNEDVDLISAAGETLLRFKFKTSNY